MVLPVCLAKADRSCLVGIVEIKECKGRWKSRSRSDRGFEAAEVKINWKSIRIRCTGGARLFYIHSARWEGRHEMLTQ